MITRMEKKVNRINEQGKSYSYNLHKTVEALSLFKTHEEGLHRPLLIEHNSAAYFETISMSPISINCICSLKKFHIGRRT